MGDTTSDPSALPAREEDAERYAGAIYGTIVVAGVLVGTAGASQAGSVDAVRAGVLALSTVVVFWLAHAWARTVARRATGLPVSGRWEALRLQWPMLVSAIPPIVVMAAASTLGANDDDAVTAAVWSSVIILAAVGALVAHRENASRTQIVISALGSALLGALLVVLKALVQH